MTGNDNQAYAMVKVSSSHDVTYENAIDPTAIHEEYEPIEPFAKPIETGVCYDFIFCPILWLNIFFKSSIWGEAFVISHNRMAQAQAFPVAQSDAESGRFGLYGQRAAAEQGRHRADWRGQRRAEHGQKGPMDRRQ